MDDVNSTSGVGQIGEVLRGALFRIRGVCGRLARFPFSASFVIVSCFCLASYFWLDRYLNLFVKPYDTTHLYSFFRILTLLGDALSYFVILPFIVIVCQAASCLIRSESGIKTMKLGRNAGLYLLLSLSISGVILNLIKPIVGRLRPEFLFEHGLYGVMPFNLEFDANSFPSGHAQVIWAMAIGLTLIHRRYDALYILIAILVSFSRIIVQAHYLSDVVMGAYIGTVTAILVKRMLFDARNIPLTLVFKRDFPTVEASCPASQAHLKNDSGDDNAAGIPDRDTGGMDNGVMGMRRQ